MNCFDCPNPTRPIDGECSGPVKAVLRVDMPGGVEVRREMCPTALARLLREEIVRIESANDDDTELVVSFVDSPEVTRR